MDRYINDLELERLYMDIPMKEFYGSVLYIGMGSAWVPRNQSDSVNQTTIVEIDPNIVQRYGDLIKPEWKIIIDDAWRFNTYEKFDFIFIDIWDSMVPIKYIEMIRKKYSNFLNPGGRIIFLEKVIKK